jgi:hypothetical protein
VARGEHQAQQVVADIVVERGVEVGRLARAGGLQVMAQFLVLALDQLCAAQAVDGAVPGGGHQPGAGLVGDAGARPPLQGGNQGVLRQLLGETHIAHHAGEAGDQLRPLDAEHRLDGAMGAGGGGVGGRHGRRSDHAGG